MPDMQTTYDRINETTRISISLASPNDIRSWSFGEVKTPETINYRTYKPEKDGLFCEKIFGPERDWECSCGKFKGIKYKDIICDRCGVKVTTTKVRRQRMGHINLAVPVVHIWFFRAMPSRLGNLLGIKSTALQQVIYFQRYVVTDPGDTPLKKCELLSEEKYRECREQYGTDFEAGMGAESVLLLLKELDLETMETSLKEELSTCTQKLKTETLVKRLRLVQALLRGQNDPSWMCMDVVPVIPPDLRPLVPLDSGNFATSDLNDLYRRVIYRNNRLSKLLDLNAPSVIVRNEKRMLQQAVDALFDNGRCKRPVQGAGNRPLKSLTDMIKGKQGRFRANLLGKRVDYSARSVIIVGPELKLDQVGLPKKIALELFQPFIIRKLKEKGLADTIKSAKTMLERKDEEIWDVLEEVIEGHPVMLNRAPTLHRMGIQAFYPTLVEGDAIRIHPLVCSGFNADFDGDQMAVHLPLTIPAQTEASMLMISTANIFSPAHGGPIITADLDIVLGCYYLTLARDNAKGEGKIFRDFQEVLLAHDEGHIAIGARIKVRMPAGMDVVAETRDDRADAETGLLPTTAGRILFNDILPKGMSFYNKTMNKKALNSVVSDCHLTVGREATVVFLDAMKEAGFHYATVSGVSFAATDLRTPAAKEGIINEAEEKVNNIEDAHQMGDITDGERYNQIVDAWTHVGEKITDELLKELKSDVERGGEAYLNPIWAMFDSGARGSTTQVRQLAGWRGLMTKPNGRIIETPIRANFREGLRGLEYFSSTHGARKGLADTALKTADSGYLTRKLVEVAQDVTINALDCGTGNGVPKGAVTTGEHEEVSFADNIFGRCACDNIVDILTGEMIVAKGEMIDREAAKKIQDLNLGKIRVRSPLTCELSHGICARCYGMDLSTGKLVEGGTAVGVIAAQSIGEPGTQLTMRTFHIGGIAKHAVRESELRADVNGSVRFVNLRTVTTTRKNEKGQDFEVEVVLNRNGAIAICDEKGRELAEPQDVPVGAMLKVMEGDEVKERKTMLAEWDPYNTPILTEKAGTVHFDDIEEGKTMRREIDESGHERIFITEHKGDLHPLITIKDVDNHALACYSIPEKAVLRVKEGDRVGAGQELARTPREIGGTQDITGGLPRVTELFEARKPKDPAVMAQIDGIVELGDRRRGKQVVLIKPEGGTLPATVEIALGDAKAEVKAGDIVTEGATLGGESTSPFDGRVESAAGGVIRLRRGIHDLIDAPEIPEKATLATKHGGTVKKGDKLCKKKDIEEVAPADGILFVDESGSSRVLQVLPIKHIDDDPAEHLLPLETKLTVQTGDLVARGEALYTPLDPKDRAGLASIDGVVAVGGTKRGKQVLLIYPEAAALKPVEHLVPQGKHVRVHTGDRVRAGEALCDGPLVPHEILAITGEDALHNYLLDEIQRVYRAQNVRINDKHIEIIVRQMMNKVQIDQIGDTPFLITDAISKPLFNRINKQVMDEGGRPATCKPLLQGVARASLSSESVIAAASFQETTRVLTDAAMAGRVDNLRGLKENVLIGRMIPAGTGFPALRQSLIRFDESALPRKEIEEEPEDELTKDLENVLSS